MKDKTEFCIAVVLFAFILSIGDIAYMRHLLNSFHLNGESFTLNGESFSQLGMVKDENPKDHKVFYFPIYEKVTK